MSEDKAAFRVWVDADACPAPIKQILFRAATRTRVPVTLLANHTLTVPASPYINFVQVQKGFDVADDEIVLRASAGDLVITSDIPLAAEVVEKGCLALNPRGELYTRENVRARLNMRDFMATMRDVGVQTGGAATFSQADRQLFASKLDSLLAKAQRQSGA
ncbi:MAG: YaiI/YqxD family protein [Halioglobus sp.]